MKKIMLLSDCEDPNLIAPPGKKTWYTVVHDEEASYELAKKNPWVGLESIIEAKTYLMDDCVVIFRPARNENGTHKGDSDKGYYFIEISNQDASIVLSSRKIYLWDEVIKIADLFKGLSFQAATRVWHVKKY